MANRRIGEMVSIDGEEIKEALLIAGISHRQIERALGKTSGTVNKWLKRGRIPRDVFWTISWMVDARIVFQGKCVECFGGNGADWAKMYIVEVPIKDRERFIEFQRNYSFPQMQVAKEIIRANFEYGDCGLYDTRNIAGDEMTSLYSDKQITIDICYGYGYFEVFGLSCDEFAELKEFYRKLQEERHA